MARLDSKAGGQSPPLRVTAEAEQPLKDWRIIAPAALARTISVPRLAAVRCFVKKRLVILFAAIGTVLILTASFQRIQPTQQLTVYDSEGKKVGVVISAGSAYSEFVPLVPFRIGEPPIILYVFRDGFVADTVVGWESANCSGAPVIPFGTPDYPPTPSSLPLVAVGIPGSTVYVEAGVPRTITLRSVSTAPLWTRDTPSLPTKCVQRVYPWTGLAVPTRPLIDMNTLYKPPFSVR